MGETKTTASAARRWGLSRFMSSAAKVHTPSRRHLSQPMQGWTSRKAVSKRKTSWPASSAPRWNSRARAAVVPERWALPVSSTMFMVVSSLQFSPAGVDFFRGFRGRGSPICRFFVRGRLPQIPVYQPRSGLSRGAEAQKTAPGAVGSGGAFFTLPSDRSSGSPGAGCCGGRGRGGRCPRPSRPRGPRRRGPGRRGWARPR